MPVLFLVPSTWDAWREWLREDLPALVAIVLVVIAVDFIFRRLVSRVLRRAIVRASRVRHEEPRLVERRADTLVATFNWLFAIFLMFIGTALVLDTLGLNVSALVASVGVAGLAIGLGAQTLIRDVINGTFILLEDQYGVGDVVTVAGISGAVVEINPRRTVLRDLNGHVHTIPNSAISVATNMTSGFSRINLDVTVPREIGTEDAIRMVNDACDALAAARPADILSAPSVLRIDQLTEGGVILKVLGDVRPATQWELTGELRRLIKQRFDQAGADLLQPLRPIVLREEAARDGGNGKKEEPSEDPAVTDNPFGG
ncbi:MAG: mechanosensitive ion channel family protein [Dehalococcoidia bacterium]|nr:mechanosensitive ion channel family protein [Dehalococcoidia bacterium]